MEKALVLATDLRSQLGRLRRFAQESGTPTLDDRLELLERLRSHLMMSREGLAESVSADFGSRSRFETLMAEVLTVVRAIDDVRKNLRQWMRPRRTAASWLYRPGRAEVRPQPKGVIGVIGAWNYPINLTLEPVVGAIAAGNRVMVKPSEHAPRTAEAVKSLLDDSLGERWVHVALGGVDVAIEFSRLEFDHLLFTGSTEVGRSIMQAASENLVPVTLELGGKSPVIVTEDRFGKSGLERTAHGIAFGKLFNAGQTCIAPDYAWVPEGRVDEFAEAIQNSIHELYPTLLDNTDYSGIIDERHAARLRGYLRQAMDRRIRVIEINPAREDMDGQWKKMKPALVIDPPDDLDLMREEIFGPILPIKSYRSLSEVIDYINVRPRPLALYVFSDDNRKVDRILDETVSGGAAVNETMLQFAEDRLPFGGVGASGMGAYHGKTSFETFSHLKPVFVRTRFDPMSLFRPPYGPRHQRFLDWLFGE